MEINLRLANNSDIELVFNWQQQKAIRQFSFNKKKPLWEEHKSWMESRLLDQTSFFYIVEIKDEKSIGVVRLDFIKKNDYLLSIFIDPQYSGNGFATKSLKLLEEKHKNKNIYAYVFSENIASISLFKKLNYKQQKFFIKDNIKVICYVKNKGLK